MIDVNTTGGAISQAFITAVSQPYVEYDMRLMAGGVDSGIGIQRLTLTLGAGLQDYDTEDFSIGGVYASQMSASLYDVTGTLTGNELEVQVGVNTGSEYEYVTVAYITITQATEWQGITHCQGVGRAAKLNAALGLSGGSYTPAQLVAAVSTASGVSVALGAFSQPQSVDISEGMSCRDALEALGKRIGAFTCEVGGSLLVSPYSSASTFSITDDIITQAPQLPEQLYELDGLTVTAQSDGTERVYTYGTGRLHVLDDKATQSTADALWASLQGYAYQAGTVTVAIIDPRVTPADVAAVPYNNTTRYLPTRGISITYDGGYFGTYSAAGLSAEAEDALVEGAVTRQSRQALSLAQEAEAVAGATAQRFWYDANGAHVSTEANNQTGEANSVWNSQGLLIRKYNNNLAALTPSGVAFYDGAGNDDGNIVASFGTQGAQVGQRGSRRIILTQSGISMLNDDSAVLFDLNLDGAITGQAIAVEQPIVQKVTRDTVTQVDMSQTETYTLGGVTAGSDISVELSTAAYFPAWYVPVEGTEEEELVPMVMSVTNVTSGYAVDVFTLPTFDQFLSMTPDYREHLFQGTASSDTVGFTANLRDGLAVGVGVTIAYDGDTTLTVTTRQRLTYTPTSTLTDYVGFYTKVNGTANWASNTKAPSYTLGTRYGDAGAFSAALGEGLYADGEHQLALGRYNLQDSSDQYALIIGNGTDDENRSNALTIDWDGNISGVAKYNGNFTGNIESTNITTGIWDIDSGNPVTINSQNIYGGFIQFGGNYKPQLVIGGDTPAESGNIYVRRWLTGQQAWGDWVAYKELIDSKQDALTRTTTSTIAQVVTEATNFSVNSANYAQYGNVASFAINVKTTNALTANTSYTVGTLVSGKRPAIVSELTHGSSAAIYGSGQVNPGGALVFRPSAAVAAGATLYLRATYII